MKNVNWMLVGFAIAVTGCQAPEGPDANANALKMSLAGEGDSSVDGSGDGSLGVDLVLDPSQQPDLVGTWELVGSYCGDSYSSTSRFETVEFSGAEYIVRRRATACPNEPIVRYQKYAYSAAPGELDQQLIGGWSFATCVGENYTAISNAVWHGTAVDFYNSNQYLRVTYVNSADCAPGLKSGDLYRFLQ